MRDIGTNIRAARNAKGLTQDELAERIHTTRQTVSNYETGRSQPDLETLSLLAEALECDEERLLYGKARPATDPREVRRLVIALCCLAGILLMQFATSRSLADRNSTYQLKPWLIIFFYQLHYARTLLLGWCAIQALTVLRLLPARPCRWLHIVFWCLLSLWPLYWLVSMMFSGQAPLWLTTITRLLLRFHLWPDYFVGDALTFCLGAAIRFTEKA